MVKKLFKHEFAYYIRTLTLFLPLILVIGTMVRIFRFLDNDTYVTRIMIGSSIAMLVISSIGLLLFTMVLGIVRFYKNMYGLEGYLTFTLPINNHQHIFVKLTVYLVFQSLSVLAVLCAVCIAASGQGLADFFGTIGYMLGSLSKELHVVNVILYVIEALAAVILSGASSMLLYYGCVTVGQLAKKNRILFAILAYFVHYVISQILSSLGTIIFVALGASNAFEWIFDFITNYTALFMHLALIGSILVTVGISAIYYFVTYYIMTKKLNLE